MATAKREATAKRTAAAKREATAKRDVSEPPVCPYPATRARHPRHGHRLSKPCDQGFPAADPRGSRLAKYDASCLELRAARDCALLHGADVASQGHETMQLKRFGPRTPGLPGAIASAHRSSGIQHDSPL
jgi:hypothetical protein